MAEAPGPTHSGVDFNFGNTGEDVSILAGSSRPGARKQLCFSDCAAKGVPPEDVAEWVAFMKEHGVAAVVSLLSDDEVGTYAAPCVEDAMRAAFGDHYARFNLKDDGAASPADVLAAIEENTKAGRKTVVHCWGGGGRTGLVQAAWLARSQGLSAADAAAAVVAYSKKQGLPRRVDVAALEAFLTAASGSK